MNDAKSSGDRNLLFGVLALQAGAISEPQLMGAIKHWTFHQDTSLGDILVEQSALSREKLQLIAPIVDAHLKLHDQNAAKALNSITTVPDVTMSLRSKVEGQEDTPASLLATLTRDHTDSATRTHVTAPRLSTSSHSRFRIVRSHARGGLGEVYVARDTELNRDVALKEIQRRYADMTESRSRFVLEAEITGGLEHPGIVPVYGLGANDDGRPYYAMRFIQGDSLKDSIRRFHEADLDPSARSLEIRKMLGRFVDVCQAIGYAHSRGVLHRDLKPGNIMLGKYGETLVVDWGLAKVLGRDEDTENEQDETTLHPSSSSGVTPTLMGSAVGTPAFMPPEQAAGMMDQLGPHSDIYSLGATLYFLLTGKPPFQGGDSKTIIERVKSGDFDSPRSHDSSIPSALNAICLKAMATDPRDRYTSTVALAEDVERFLADEAVTAIADPWSVRARRWIRKHPTISATTSAVILISTIALSVFSTVVSGKNAELAAVNSDLDDKTVALQESNARLDQQNRALEQSIAKEQAATRLAKQNEKTAEENYGLARQSVDKYFTIVSENQLLNEPYMDELRHELLGSASEFYLAFVARRKGDPAALVDLGNARMNLARVSWEMGESEEAIETLEEAKQAYERAAGVSTPSLDTRLRQVWNTLLLGEYYRRLGRVGDAIELFSTSIEDCDEMYKMNPESIEVLNMRVRLLNSRSTFYLGQGQTADAVEDLNHVVALLEDREPSDEEAYAALEFSISRALAESYTSLGLIQFREQKFDRGKGWYTKAVALRRGLVEQANGSMEALGGLSASLSQMSQYHRRQGELDKALEMAEEATAIAKSLADEHPALATLTSAYLACINNLAVVHQVRGNLDKADELNNEGREVLIGLVNKHPEVLMYRFQLGAIEGNRGNTSLNRRKYEEAITWYDHANETLMQLLEISPQEARAKTVLRNNHWGRADAYVAIEDYPRAIAAFGDALNFAGADAAPEIRMAQAMAIARGGDYVSAAEAVEQEMARDNVSSIIRYDAARVMMLALQALEADEGLDESQVIRKADGIKSQAVELLRASFDDGYLKKDDSRSPLKSDRFEPLRELESFKQLLMDAGLDEGE